MRARTAGATVLACLATVLATAGDVGSDDRPAIVVSGEGLAPARLEVHAGEVVRWVGPSGQRLRIALDAHRGAHEIVERTPEVRALFRATGEHSYTATWADGPPAGLRGVIVVRPAARAPVFPQTCAPESSERVCFEP